MNMSREQWLKDRQKGIGGSDAPVVVLGEYFGKNVQDLFYEKTSSVVQELDGPDLRRGRRQEPIAAAYYEEMTGHKVRRVNSILQHPEFPFMLANIDREILGEDSILEIKCPRLTTFLKWKREGVPEGPVIQGQHYLAIKPKTRVVFGVFCAEVDEMMIIPVERDQELIDLIIKKESDFWQHVQAGELPEIKRESLDLPPIGGELIKIESPDWIKAVSDLQQAKEIMDEAQALEEAAKTNLQKIMEEAGADVAEGAGTRIYWKEQAGRKTLDKKRLVAEHPGIDISKYEKEGKPFRAFRPYFINKAA